MQVIKMELRIAVGFIWMAERVSLQQRGGCSSLFTADSFVQQGARLAAERAKATEKLQGHDQRLDPPPLPLPIQDHKISPLTFVRIIEARIVG